MNEVMLSTLDDESSFYAGGSTTCVFGSFYLSLPFEPFTSATQSVIRRQYGGCNPLNASLTRFFRDFRLKVVSKITVGAYREAVRPTYVIEAGGGAGTNL
jgi:hypothetical protein